MPRYHVHLVPYGVAFQDLDAAITVTLEAHDDLDAQRLARQLIAIDCDVQEIEPADEVTE